MGGSSRELVSILMQMPVKRRVEAILEQDEAEAVVAALAVQDFYFTVKEIGVEDSIPLLALARIEQLNHLFGMEWWQRDQIQPAKAIDWLNILARASDRKVLAWLYQADFELLVALFKKWIRLAMAPEDVDPLESRDYLPANTLDDQYYWDATYPQYEDFLRRLLSLIFEVHQGFYRELMNHVLWASEGDMEEQAYRFNRGRLEDEAIPEFYDAIEIYHPMKKQQIPCEKDFAVARNEDTFGAPRFALALVPERDLLGAGLRAISDRSLMDTLQMELAALANKVIIADELSLDHPEGLRQAVDKAAAYVNLGLHLKSAGVLSAAVETLRCVFLQDLFRFGHAQVAGVKNRLRQIVQTGWLSKWPHGMKCLDSEWADSAELLLQKTPRLLRPRSRQNTSHMRQDLFRDQNDLHVGNRLVGMIGSVGALYDALNPQPEALGGLLWGDGQVRSLEDMTLGVMIWTACGNSLLLGQWVVSPIPVSRWPLLFPRLNPEVLMETIHRWIDDVVLDPDERSLAEAYIKPIFDAYEEEMAPFFRKGNPPILAW